ncbi:MAG: nucleotidyltransferase family protein, partial [Chloroflexi bacterium]|nr:nucleotidyltransferase family protein [Chloroflexota bacterium]
MKAVVLVGGEGTRLRPLTCGTPKPMVPVVNKPFLVHTFERLKQHNITEVILAAHYLPDQIKRYFGDGHGLGITLTYSLEESPLGTAGAVKNAEAFLDNTFFVLNGDVLSDLDITQLLAYHREREAVATLALMPAEDPTSFGVVETSPRGKVRRFLEKPSWESVTTNMVNGGCYVLEPEVLDEMEPGAFCSFEHNLFPRLLQMNLPVYGFPTQGYWIDIGT